MATRDFTTTPRGECKEGHPRAKLTPHEVALIAELIENGMTLREIAAKFAPKS